MSKGEFDDSDVSYRIEYGVKKFLEWIKSGKLEIRIYTESPLHAKVYITRNLESEITENVDSVITGSSNFSEAGLITNLEFNVELKDYADIKFAYDKFEELWKYGEPVSEEYIEVIQNHTWLKNDITPYEIYLKTLYEFFKSADFSKQFIVDLQSDLNNLKHLRKIWESVTSDPKLNQLKKELQTNTRFQGNKKIIFTESKETAEYLYRELKKIFGDRIIFFSGGSSEGLKAKIEKSFDPTITNPEDKFDLLVTTDVLSEGVNLHRANSLINYDLPWNPTRIMQRVGRINRVGTKHDEIFVFNFFPTDATKRHLPLEDRILEKLQMFHETLGEDFKYLSESEEVSPKNLFDTLNANLGGEDEETNPELEYLKIIREIRDNDKLLFEKIKRLPKKARTGKSSDKVEAESTLTFARSGALKTFFVSDSSKTEQLSFLDAIELLQCEPSAKQIPIGEKFFEQYDANEFKILLEENESDMFRSKRTPTNVRNVVATLKALARIPDFTDDQEEVIRRIVKAFNEGDIPARYVQKINQAIKTEKDPMQLFKRIYNIIDESYLFGRQRAENFSERQRQVILSCSLKGS